VSKSKKKQSQSSKNLSKS